MLCHDPRVSNDRSEKHETDNLILILVEQTRQAHPTAELDWDKIAEAADHIDWPVDPNSGEGLFGGGALAGRIRAELHK
jgi:hypothetical protein